MGSIRLYQNPTTLLRLATLAISIGPGSMPTVIASTKPHGTSTTVTRTQSSRTKNAQAEDVVDSYLEQILCSNVEFKIWKEGLYQAAKPKVPENDIRKAFSEDLFYSLMPGQEKQDYRYRMPEIFLKARTITSELSDLAVFFSSTIHELFEKENERRIAHGKTALSKEDFLVDFGKSTLSLKNETDGFDYREWIDTKIQKIEEATKKLRYGCAGNRNFIYRTNSRLGSVIDLDSFVIPATDISAKKIADSTANARRTSPTHEQTRARAPRAAVLSDDHPDTHKRAETQYESPIKGPTIRSHETVGATFYFIPQENDTRYQGKPERHIFDENGHVIAKVSESFYQALKVQGSGILANGQTINFTKISGGIRRFSPTSSRYGLGNANNPLKPWRSIAIDFNYYRKRGLTLKIGQSIYIPSTRGLKIPESNPTAYHDGYWEIADQGGDIKGARIDMFTGTMHWKDALSYVNNPSNYSSGKRAAEANLLGSPKNLITMKLVR